jgi:hypothetical protein
MGDNLLKLKWTWRTVAISAVGVWLALLAIFSAGRICEPLLSAKCNAHFWTFIGDLIWLKSLDQWQTLATGGIAIVAALIGGYYINKQIGMTERQEQEKQAREFEAMRALLPLYLSNLLEHVSECASGLRSIYIVLRHGPQPTQTTVPEFPAVPMEIALFLQTAIFRSPAAYRQPFVEILLDLQVFDARLRMLRSNYARPSDVARVSQANLQAFTIQAIDIYARCESLLPFARKQSEDLPTPGMIAGRYTTVLSILGFDDENAPGLLQAIADRVVRSTAPNRPDES